MLVRLGPNWVFVLVLLAGLGTLLEAQRRVVVSSSEGLHLRWTAYRLGVSVERIGHGRRALQLATDLAPEVAGSGSVGSLGDMWLQLNSSEAHTQITSLIKELRRLARVTEDPAVYGQVTKDAQSLKNTLLMINEDAARQILDNWPGPPEGESLRLQETSREQQMKDMRRISQLASTDLDAAFEMLSELEAGQPNPMLRMSLLYQLEFRGRSEEADQLFAQMLEAMPNVQDASQAQGYISLLSWVARSRRWAGRSSKRLLRRRSRGPLTLKPARLARRPRTTWRSGCMLPDAGQTSRRP